MGRLFALMVRETGGGWNRLARALVLLVLALTGAAVSAQAPVAASPGEDLEIYVSDDGAGRPGLSRFGHNAIGIRE
jgi:hypothetical protein